MKKTAIIAAVVMPMAGLGTLAARNVAADSIPVTNLEEVEVVANRATAKTPVAFTTVTAEQINRVNDGRDLPYLLSATPSVITTSDAGTGTGYTSIRVRGTDGSRINVTANGVPVNDAESHNVYWVNLPDMASSVADIQIQRGAGTSTNGAGAFGASINMLTSTPSIIPFGELNASYGMYGTNKQTLRAATGLINNHWTVDCRLSHIGTDGYIDRAWAKMWSYFGQIGYYNGSTSLKFIAFGGKEQTYMAWDYASKEDMEKYGRRYNPCGKYTDDEGNTAFYPNQIDNYTQHNFQLLYNQSLGSNWKINAALHYTKGDGFYEQYKTRRTLIEYGLSPFMSDGKLVEKSDLVRLKNMDNGFGGAVASVTYNRGPLNAIAGGAINHYRGHHFGQISWVRNYVGQIDPLQEYYRNTGDKTDGNFYLRASLDLPGGFSGYADLQYRHIGYSITGVSDTYDWNTGTMQNLDIHHHYNFFNPKLGINWHPDSHHRAYISWATAHKEPTRDNFIDCAPDKGPVPERLHDYELGYEFQKGILNVGVNIYYMKYKNQLVPTGQLSDTGNAVSVNVPDSYRAGVELTGALKPCKWMDWQLTATFSRNRIKDFVEYIYEDEWTNPISLNLGDTPLAFSPSITLHNSFNFSFAGFDASLQSQYVGKQYLTNAGNKEAMLNSYFVTDLHLGYSIKKIAGLKELRLGFAIYNLFSEKYENNGYAGAGYYVDDNGEKIIYRYAGYAAQAPIHVMGSVTLKF